MKKPASKKAKSQATSKLLKRPAAALGKKKAAAPTDGENQTEEQVDTEPTAKKTEEQREEWKKQELERRPEAGKERQMGRKGQEHTDLTGQAA